MNQMTPKPQRKGGQPLEIWVIYDHPLDHPDYYVVRHWRVGPDAQVSVKNSYQLAPTLGRARALVPEGLFNLGRFEYDDPVIVETWI